MSYRVRYTLPDGRTGLWAHEYQTRETAQAAIDDRLGDTGFAYAVEEVTDVPEPGSTAAHHVEILRARVNELEALVEARGRAVTDAHVANHAMHRDLAFAIQIGDAMREAMRTGSWGHDGEGHLASVSAGAWDRFKASLAASVQGTAKASEAPGEGGDSGQGSKRDAKADDEDGGDVAVTIDQLMRRMAVRLRTVCEALEHPAGQVSLKDAARLTDSALKDLHEVAAKLQAVGREI